MPEISAFCPGCGRSVRVGDNRPRSLTDADPMSFDALLGAVSYFTILAAALLLLIPQTSRNKFMRFHAWQSAFFSLATLVIAGATRLAFAGLSYFPFIGFLSAWLLAGVVFLAIVFTWALLVLKAALGDAYELPWLGSLAARVANRG
jgi:uncharacterized membrane protein